MTHGEFNHLLNSIKALSPMQMRQLRRQIDSELTHHEPHDAGPTNKERARTPGKSRRRASTAPKHAGKPLSEAEFNQHLLDIGLVTALPDPTLDINDDDPDDVPVVIKGEPLSETIIRERR
jgi:hypothetical protein